jgi:type II secretory pathway component PulK
VEALADFVDADDTGGYEAGFYRAAKPPSAPPNRELWAPAELLRVHGFSTELFQPRPRAASDDLFGGELVSATTLVPVPLKEPLPVNVNTAGRDVLMGVAGLEQEAAVRAVLSLRQVKPFESLGMMFMANPELAAALEGTLSVASTYFRVRARAAAEFQQSSVLAWVERSPAGDIRILQWIEGG